MISLNNAILTKQFILAFLVGLVIDLQRVKSKTKYFFKVMVSFEVILQMPE